MNKKITTIQWGLREKLLFIFLSFAVAFHSQTLVNQKLYMSQGQTLDRIDPVATSDLTLSKTDTIYKIPATVVSTYTSGTSNKPAVSPGTFSCTVSNGPNRLLLVGISSYNNNASNYVTAVKFGGVNLTKLDHVTNGLVAKTEIWYLLNPTVSTANV